MSGPRRNRLTGLSKSTVKRKRILRSAEVKSELDLPTELLELILSRLSSRDKARVSAVCRKWEDVTKSMEKVNRPPMLMYARRDYNSFDFYDVATCNITVRVPKRPGNIVWHSKDGWILLFDHYTRDVTLFHPHTLESVKLPRLHFAFHGAAFSAPPTSPNCFIFTTCSHLYPSKVDIVSCCLGDNAWTTTNYQCEEPFIGCLWNCLVACNGIFYYLNSTGHIMIYDPVRATWRALPVEPLKFMKYLNIDDCLKHLFMAEYNGDIFLVRTWHVVRPVVYKLDENNMWVKVKHLEGATFFASPTNSLIKDYMPKPMRDCIIFSKVVYKQKQCVTYSLRLKKYYHMESQSFDVRRLERYEYIWVDFEGQTL